MRAPSSASAASRLSSRRGGLEDLPLQGRGGGEQARVDVRQGLAEALALRALHQRRELEQLEVADDPVGDVEVGVQAQLAQAPADAPDAVQDLLAQHGQSRLQRLARLGGAGS